MAANLAHVVFEPISEVPETASVCHFDEIKDPIQDPLVLAADRNQSTVTVAPIKAALIDECDCEIVKFTDYYRMSRV